MIGEKEVVLLLKGLYGCRDRLDAICRILEIVEWNRSTAEIIVSDLLSISLRLKAISNALISKYKLFEEEQTSIATIKND